MDWQVVWWIIGAIGLINGSIVLWMAWEWFKSFGVDEGSLEDYIYERGLYPTPVFLSSTKDHQHLRRVK